jgi:aspartate dehydrogenase
MEKRIGIIGFGRIGSYLYERAGKDEQMTMDFATDAIPKMTEALEPEKVLKSFDEIGERSVDLIVEAANADVVTKHAKQILMTNDLMILSVTALADADFFEHLEFVCQKNGTRLFVPHGALLGMDGLFDAKHTLDEVTITTTKNPRNIDFSYTDKYEASDIKKPTVLYDGPARGICSMFPRNVNSHAIVSLAGIGFDKTRAILIADPTSDDAVQHIIAKGQGTVLEIKRSSAIKGVTGEYTLASIYGSVRRAVLSPYGVNIV